MKAYLGSGPEVHASAAVADPVEAVASWPLGPEALDRALNDRLARSLEYLE